MSSLPLQEKNIWKVTSNSCLKRNQPSASPSTSASRPVVPPYDKFAEKHLTEKEEISNLLDNVKSSIECFTNKEGLPKEKNYNDECFELIKSSLEEVPKYKLLACFKEVMLFIEKKK